MIKKWLAIAAAIAPMTACGGAGSPTTPTSSTPPANIAGPYNANIIASASCAANLPADARAQIFAATITQTGSAVQMQLVSHQGGTATVSGTVSGQAVSFSSISLNETVGHGATLVASATASVGPNGAITGTLSGTYQTPSGATCNAANHQLEMVKLCQQATANGVALVPCQ
jgi:hypothetical protein